MISGRTGERVSKTPKRLATLLSGVRVGTLNQDPNGRLGFVYEDDYPVDATPLSPSLPRREQPYTHADVAPYVAGLLPDNEQVLERWASMFGVRSRNVFALLSHVGTDCAGAVQFVREDQLDELSDAGSGGGGVVDIDDDGVEAMLRDLRVNPYTWQQPGGGRGGHFSLAGAHAKFALHRTERGWGRPSGSNPTTHIFKPSMIGVANHDVNEHLSLRAASSLGLIVARSELSSFGRERAIVVERFDRTRRDGRVVRVHQVDMCQALAVMPELKYHRDGGPGPGDIIGLLNQVGGGAADVDRFVKSLLFNWVIGGTDAHAKNYGLLMQGLRARLTPLYDVASAVVLDEWNPHTWELAMRINKKGRFKYLRIDDWYKFARTVGVSTEMIRSTTLDFVERIGDALADAAVAFADNAECRQFSDRFRDAVALHAATIDLR